MKKFLSAIALGALVATVACSKPEEKMPAKTDAPKVVEETTTTTSTTVTTASTTAEGTGTTATTATTVTTATTATTK